MKIELSKFDCDELRVDRDSTSCGEHKEGLDVFLADDVTIHFQDEDDAIQMARAIFDRLGLEHLQK